MGYRPKEFDGLTPDSSGYRPKEFDGLTPDSSGYRPKEKNARHGDGCRPSSWGYQPKIRLPRAAKKMPLVSGKRYQGAAAAFLASRRRLDNMTGVNRVVRAASPKEKAGLCPSGAKSRERKACPRPSGTRKQGKWDSIRPVWSRTKGKLVLILLA